MRHSEFWFRMEHHLGFSYARVWSQGHVLSSLEGHTVDEALAAGESPKDVWRAVWAELELPPIDR